MPASDEMESGFCFRPPLEGRALSRPIIWDDTAVVPPVLMHPGGYAVTAIGPDTCRAAAEGAENYDRRDEGE